MFFAMLLVVAAHNIEQEAVDKLAHCWRTLRHGHGEPVDVSYACATDGICFLSVATCSPVSVRPKYDSNASLAVFNGSESDFSFSIELHHNVSVDRWNSSGTEVSTEVFTIQLRDHLGQGIVASGRVGSTFTATKRQLIMLSDLLDPSHLIVPEWNGYAETPIFGERRDCAVESCPKKWENCWSDSRMNMLQVEVFVVMHQTFCDQFPDKSESVCADFVTGAFKDLNLVYESQLRVSLKASVLISPTAFKRYWPHIHTSLSGALSERSVKGAIHQLAGNRGHFQQVTKRDVSQFGLFHVMIGTYLVARDGSVVLGGSSGSSLCTGASSWSGVHKNFPTWVSIAQSTAHAFGALDSSKVENAGLLGKGDKKVQGVYAFSDEDKGAMCFAVRNHKNTCMFAYYGRSELDPRVPLLNGLISTRLDVMAVQVFFVIFAILCICCCCIYFVGNHFYERRAWRNHRLEKLYKRLEKEKEYKRLEKEKECKRLEKEKEYRAKCRTPLTYDHSPQPIQTRAYSESSRSLNIEEAMPAPVAEHRIQPTSSPHSSERAMIVENLSLRNQPAVKVPSKRTGSNRRCG